jgi:dihydropteroate synthase
MTSQELALWQRDSKRSTLVMGVLNVTPDSFSDGGAFAGVDAAVAHAEQMCLNGADVIDIGGESTRPGSGRIEPAEQIRRILPVFQRLSGKLPAILSVDTTRSEVARAAADNGATIVNDISGGLDDHQMLPLIASRGLTAVLMHMQGQPETMQIAPHYSDVIHEVKQFLSNRLRAAEAAGIETHRVLLDPGIGFGKTMEHNLALLRNLKVLAAVGRPLVVGTSRKGFIGRITGEDEPSKRLFGTAASVAWAVANGAAVVRVHDVGPMAKVVKMVRAIQFF